MQHLMLIFKTNLAIPTGLNATLNADLKVLAFHEPATIG